MLRGILTALLIGIVLGGCSAVNMHSISEPPASAPDKYVGKTLWVDPKRPLSLCRNPVTKPLANIDTDCFRYANGRFTVERVETDEKRIYTTYLLRVPDGRSGYVKDLDLIWTDDEGEHRKKLAAKAECDRRGGVSVGMTRAQVYASCWGKPLQTNLTRTSSGDHEQLVYSGHNYVYLRNGIVTSIQTSR